MRPIPKGLRDEMSRDPFYLSCARKKDGGCRGRLTWEHTLIFDSKQINEKWTIIPLCAYHHAVDMYQDAGDLVKEKNIWIALSRATDQELNRISKAIDYKRMRKQLNEKYGIYQGNGHTSVGM